MKKQFYILLILISISLGTLVSCNKTTSSKTIILSKVSSNYVNWISKENTVILDAYTILNTDSILALADGIILTGGEDINPLLYKDSLNLNVCETINHYRDTLELKLIDYAFKNEIPLVGVCRGMQLINVATGGDLYGDIPSQLGTEVVHRNNGEVMHEITLIEECPNIFPKGSSNFTVNSWHHQGLKDISENIKVVAESSDELPEAIIVDQSVHPYMVAVQFHPERLGENHPITKRIKTSFYKAIEK